jgi:hypothetical protein
MKDPDLEGLSQASKRAAEIIRLSQRPLVEAQISPALAEAARSFNKLNLGSSTALAEAAKSYAALSPTIGPAIAEAMKGYRSPQISAEFAEAFRVSAAARASALGATTSATIGTVLQAQLAEALKGWRVPPPLTRSLAEAVRKAALTPGFQVSPLLVGEAVRRAAEVAEDLPANDPATQKAVASFEQRHSPEDWLELQSSILKAIGWLATVVAVLVGIGMLDLAGPLIGLMAELILIHGQLRKK